MTIYEVADLQQSLLQRIGKARQLHIDLEGVEEIDSAGGQILISLAKSFAEEGRKLQIDSLSPVVLNFMKSMGFLNNPLFGDCNERFNG